MEQILNIYQKLLEAQKLLPCLVKEKAKSDGLKYSFVSHDEVTTEVKRVFNGLGLLCLATVDSSIFNEVEVEKWDYKASALKKAVNTYCTLNITVKIINVDAPSEVVETKAVGQGIDECDKATGKAYSYAFKYALLKLLMAETAEDSDKDQQTTKQEKPKDVGKPNPKPKSATSKVTQYNKFLDNIKTVKTTEQAEWLKSSYPKWLEWTKSNYSVEYCNQLQDAYDAKLESGLLPDDDLPDFIKPKN
ncbi:MAG: ERF family protein [Cetobacterium sp.]